MLAQGARASAGRRRGLDRPGEQRLQTCWLLQQSVQMLCEETRLDAGRPTVLHLSDLGRSTHGLKGRKTVGRPAN